MRTLPCDNSKWTARMALPSRYNYKLTRQKLKNDVMCTLAEAHAFHPSRLSSTSCACAAARVRTSTSQIIFLDQFVIVHWPSFTQSMCVTCKYIQLVAGCSVVVPCYLWRKQKRTMVQDGQAQKRFAELLLLLYKWLPMSTRFQTHLQQGCTRRVWCCAIPPSAAWHHAYKRATHMFAFMDIVCSTNVTLDHARKLFELTWKN